MYPSDHAHYQQPDLFIFVLYSILGDLTICYLKTANSVQLIELLCCLGQKTISANTLQVVQILGNNTSLDSICKKSATLIQLSTDKNELTLVGPSVIIQLCLPSPKDPSLLLLISMNLRRKPLSIKVGIRTGIPIGGSRDSIRDSKTPFANDIREVTITLIAAGCANVVIMRGVNACIPFQVAVIIIGHVCQVVEILVWITRTPGLIHCLNMEVVVRVD